MSESMDEALEEAQIDVEAQEKEKSDNSGKLGNPLLVARNAQNWNQNQNQNNNNNKKNNNNVNESIPLQEQEPGLEPGLEQEQEPGRRRLRGNQDVRPYDTRKQQVSVDDHPLLLEEQGIDEMELNENRKVKGGRVFLDEMQSSDEDDTGEDKRRVNDDDEEEITGSYNAPPTTTVQEPKAEINRGRYGIGNGNGNDNNGDDENDDDDDDDDEGGDGKGVGEDWGAVRNLDQFFQNVYEYYQGGGLRSIIATRLVNLATMAFTVVYSSFLMSFIDWPRVMECKDEASCGTLVSYVRPPFWWPSSSHDSQSSPKTGSSSQHRGGKSAIDVFTLLYVIVLFGYWVWTFVSFWPAIRAAWKMHSFFQNKLGLSTRQIQTMEWGAIVSRIVALQESGKYRMLISGERLTAQHIMMRIMRKQNYMIAMVNHGVLPLGSGANILDALKQACAFVLLGIVDLARCICTLICYWRLPDCCTFQQSGSIVSSSESETFTNSGINRYYAPEGASVSAAVSNPISSMFSGGMERGPSGNRAERKSRTARVIDSYGQLDDRADDVESAGQFRGRFRGDNANVNVNVNDNASTSVGNGTLAGGLMSMLNVGTWYLGRVLEYNLNLAVFDHMFSDTFQLRQGFVSSPARLKRRFIALGFLNLILTPFTLGFATVYFILRFAEEFHSKKQYLGPRWWTPYFTWKARGINEAPHLTTRRLYSGLPYGERYIRQFPNPEASSIASGISFISGSIVGVLLLLTFIDESILLHVTFGDRNLFWFVAVFSTLLALSRTLVPPAEDMVFSPNAEMRKTSAYTHYMPDHWQRNCHSYDVRDEFILALQFKVELFVREVASILCVPIVFCVVLPKFAEDIITFASEYTVSHSGVGDVCVFSLLHLDENGDESWGSPAPTTATTTTAARTTTRTTTTTAIGGPNHTARGLHNVPSVHVHSSRYKIMFDGKLEKSWISFDAEYRIMELGGDGVIAFEPQADESGKKLLGNLFKFHQEKLEGQQQEQQQRQDVNESPEKKKQQGMYTHAGTDASHAYDSVNDQPYRHAFETASRSLAGDSLGFSGMMDSRIEDDGARIGKDPLEMRASRTSGANSISSRMSQSTRRTVVATQPGGPNMGGDAIGGLSPKLLFDAPLDSLKFPNAENYFYMLDEMHLWYLEDRC